MNLAEKFWSGEIVIYCVSCARELVNEGGGNGLGLSSGNVACLGAATTFVRQIKDPSPEASGSSLLRARGAYLGFYRGHATIFFHLYSIILLFGQQTEAPRSPSKLRNYHINRRKLEK